ncbi:hypothetical protein [uncultured Aquimonas sp.]|uniref:hypothetical protein n=1 Tax=uncultured Aquimonas sp. TaxID=385483 RepID=UPI000869FCC9|nr:hypothetical protein [uncultured Aquimonas sp.]ODU48073.1 MAG: hypothetical protein ABS96_01700 [Xanthomonadaceae bacterium SCN 69-123]
MNTVLPSPLLRLGLRLDAILSLAAAAAVPLLLVPLSVALGFSREQMILIAAFMFGWAALTGWMGGQARLPAWSVWLAIAVNVEWAAASLVLPAFGWIAPNALGWTLLVAQALGVLVFAGLQWLGLQRSERIGAAAAAIA